MMEERRGVDDTGDERVMAAQQRIAAAKDACTQRLRNCARLAVEGETIGAETCVELYAQGDQLDRIEDKLDVCSSTLRVAKHHVRSMESWWYRVKNAFRSRGRELDKARLAAEDRARNGASRRRTPQFDFDPPAETDSYSDVTLTAERQLHKQRHHHHHQQQQQQTAVEPDDAFEATLDRHYSVIQQSLARQKQIAMAMGDELTRQNEQLEGMSGKMDHVQSNMGALNMRCTRLLIR